jgi:hypothetical protein
MTQTVDEFIEHYGAKGMRWGVRRARNKVVKADRKWEKKAMSKGAAIQMYNMAAGNANKDLPKINAKWKNTDITKDPKAWDKYHNEVVSNFNSHLRQAANNYGVNPSGTKMLGFDKDTGELKIVSKETEHADEAEVKVVVDRDDYGHIRKILLVDDTIEHYGVKGMHWGVRKARNERVRKEAFDSKKVTELRKRGKKNLSNKQLKEVNDRLNMEQNFSRMNPSAIKKGTEAAAGILATLGVAVTAYNMATSPAGKAAIALAKKSLSK